MKVYLINDTSGAGNWGCRATTAALMRMVETRGGRIFDTMPLRRMGIASDDPVPQQYQDFESMANKMMKRKIWKPEYEALERTDISVINGEGSIYDRQRKGRSMLFMAYVAKKHFAKPCILVNHTADIHDRVMAEIACEVYPLMDDVVFREPLSLELSGGRLKGHCAADAAFIYEPASESMWRQSVARDGGSFSIWPDRAPRFNSQEPYICVGGSSIYLRPDRPWYDPVPSFNYLCKTLQEKLAPVVLTSCDVSDQTIFRQIAAQLGLPAVDLTTPTQQAVDILGNAAVYISGRWHPSIFALTGGTPIVTLTANTFKMRALIKQTGLDAPTFDALQLHKFVDDIVSLATLYISHGTTIREQLRKRTQELSVLAWDNVRYFERPS